MSRYRYAVFSRDGKSFVVDLWRLRLDKLRKKLQAWSLACAGLWSTKGVKKCMVTLTYDTKGLLVPASEWSPKHVSVFIDRLKKRKGLTVLAYSWVVELQERGVPHYHIVIIYQGVVPYPDKSGLWRYGLSNVKFRLRSPYYLIRYTGKEKQKNFSLLPSGSRAYAVSISDKYTYNIMKSLLLPEVIRERYLVEGVDALQDLVLPSSMRSQFVGNALTVSFANMLAGIDKA